MEIVDALFVAHRAWSVVGAGDAVDDAYYGWSSGPGGALFGAVPASGDAMAALPETTAAGEGGEGCAVCLEAYEAGDAVRTMPCAHGFHGPCILGWLRVSRLCPLCRFALPAEVETDTAGGGEEAGEDDDGALDSVQSLFA